MWWFFFSSYNLLYSLSLSLCLFVFREPHVDKWKTNWAISTLNQEPTLSWYRGYSTRTPTYTQAHTHTNKSPSVISWSMEPDSLQRDEEERHGGRHGERQSEINAALYCMCNFVQKVRVTHLFD